MTMPEMLFSLLTLGALFLICAGVVEGWCWLTARRRWRQSADWCGEYRGAHRW